MDEKNTSLVVKNTTTCYDPVLDNPCCYTPLIPESCCAPTDVELKTHEYERKNHWDFLSQCQTPPCADILIDDYSNYLNFIESKPEK